MEVIPRDLVDAEYRDGGGAEMAEAGGGCEALGAAVAVGVEAETKAEAGHSRRRATQAEESG